MTPASVLDQGLAALSLPMPQGARDKLLAYVELLSKWNRTYNLTAIREPENMVRQHLLDALAVVRHLPPGSLADVGSGGGLPGVPIAIVQPERRVTLNDSNQKKTAFLRQASIELGLVNAAVHAGRVEDWHPLERFAVVITRGFAELAEFIARCRHLVAPRGVFAAMKGVYPREELARVARSQRCDKVIRLQVPLLDAERHLVLCQAEA